MALSTEDIEAISAAIKQRPPVEPIKADINIGDILTKIATAGLVAGVTWLIASVSDMKTGQALIVQEQAHQKISIDTVTRVVAEGTSDRYPRQEALTDQSEMLERILEIKAKQNDSLERLERLERELAIMKATE